MPAHDFVNHIFNICDDTMISFSMGTLTVGKSVIANSIEKGSSMT